MRDFERFATSADTTENGTLDTLATPGTRRPYAKPTLKQLDLTGGTEGKTFNLTETISNTLGPS